MNSLMLLSLSLGLMLVALPLLSIGTFNGQGALWWIGFLVLIVGGVLPPATRFMDLGEDDESDDDDADNDAGEQGLDT